MSADERIKFVEEIKRDDSRYRIFLISTCTGGTGLNLINATHAVIVDEHWNPAWEAQAVDRIYRGGQEAEVNVYRLVTWETIDHSIQARQFRKQQLLK